MTPTAIAATRPARTTVSPFLDLKAQYRSIRVEINEAIQRVMASQRFILGPEVQVFEKELASYTGANSTVVCGTGVGEYAFVASGAAVTKDLSPYAPMMGVPAKQVGWTRYCGTRLTSGAAQVECSACGRGYSIQGDTCAEVAGSPEMLQEHAAAGDD